MANKIRLIGLAGLARSGKSTLAGMLRERLGYKEYALADPIKRIVNDMFGWDERHSDGELKEKLDLKWGFSPRRAYQLFGTEYGRALREDLWLRMAEVVLSELDENSGLIITDIRFPNEHAWCACHGLVVHVRRHGYTHQIKESGHESEAGLQPFAEDWVTPECKDLKRLEGQANLISSYAKGLLTDD